MLKGAIQVKKAVEDWHRIIIQTEKSSYMLHTVTAGKEFKRSNGLIKWQETQSIDQK